MADFVDLADVEARIERHRCLAGSPRPGHLDAADLSRLIEEDAPSLLAVVKQVTRLHAEHRVYGVCGHQHLEVDDFVRDVAGIGLVCEEGYLRSVCRHCCTDKDGDQTEACVATHIHRAGSLCPTRDALAATAEVAS